MSRVGEVTCEAAVFLGDRRIRTQEVVVAAPGTGEIRVRLEGCGVCASNLPVWDGRPWFQYPYTPGSPGHEGWGIVDAVGDSVTDFAVGDRVALLSSRAFAQYDIASCEQAVRLPPALDGQAVPGEPLGCALNIFRRSDIQAGQTVAIVGIGFLGAMLTDLCVQAGASVVAISRRPFARKIAERSGACATLDLDDIPRTVAGARAHTRDAGFDRVIEAIGSQEALDLCTQLVGTRATLVIAGYHQDAPRTIDMQRWNWLGLDVVNAHERDPWAYRRGMQEAIELMVAGSIEPAALFTHRFPLSEINEGFEALAARPPGFLKALVTCS
jgi:2-desacetyl-2-hydroxyethyl bacteriochlorophyllide A dehydrogenase